MVDFDDELLHPSINMEEVETAQPATSNARFVNVTLPSGEYIELDLDELDDSQLSLDTLTDLLVKEHHYPPEVWVKFIADYWRRFGAELAFRIAQWGLDGASISSLALEARSHRSHRTEEGKEAGDGGAAALSDGDLQSRSRQVGADARPARCSCVLLAISLISCQHAQRARPSPIRRHSKSVLSESDRLHQPGRANRRFESLCPRCQRCLGRSTRCRDTEEAQAPCSSPWASSTMRCELLTECSMLILPIYQLHSARCAFSFEGMYRL